MEQEIISKIQDTLANALGVEREEVTPEASLTKDLGAESIDFIDIIFRLEKAFDIKIPSGELFPGNILNDERFVQEGMVTEAGLHEIREKLPYLELDDFAKDPKLTNLAEHFKVKMVIRYIKDRLTNDAKTT